MGCLQADGKRCLSQQSWCPWAHCGSSGLCGATCDILMMREVKPFQGVSSRMFKINGRSSISEHAAQPSLKSLLVTL